MENYYCPFDYYDDYYDNYYDYFRQRITPEVIQSHVGQTALVDIRGRGTVTAHINGYNRRTDIVSLTIFTHSGSQPVRVHRRDILRITPIHVPPPQGGRPPQGGGRHLDEDFE
ncbi:hypothetical protein [Clostridium sp. BJN0013]|uniref:hypothetical protein n=1 Tax=Clostridium sp. BJN0013 TaxID=3236840 RepID=UPI0034C60159